MPSARQPFAFWARKIMTGDVRVLYISQ